MPANNDPIYSKLAQVDCSGTLTTAANDYTGLNINNGVVFTSDSINGGFVKKLRFKALGTNVASVARIYINNGLGRFASIAATMGAITPVGTQSTTGGTMNVGPGVTWFGRVWPVDALGQVGISSLEATAAATTLSVTGSISWTWTAVNGAASYILMVGTATGAQSQLFNATTNSFTQTTNTSPIRGNPLSLVTNNFLFGEVSLPATTGIATAGTIDVDYPIGEALQPGYRLLVGLGTTVASGWQVTSIGGVY